MRNNLSPEAAPWGREVDRRLSSVENTLATLNQDSTNAFKSIAASLSQLSGQVAAVQTALSGILKIGTASYSSGSPMSFTVPQATTTTVEVLSHTFSVTVPSESSVLISTMSDLVSTSIVSGTVSGNPVTGLRLYIEDGGAPRVITDTQFRAGITPATGSAASSLYGMYRATNGGFAPVTWTFTLYAYGNHGPIASDTVHALMPPQVVVQTFPIQL